MGLTLRWGRVVALAGLSSALAAPPDARAQASGREPRLSLAVIDETRGPVVLREVRWSVDGGPEQSAVVDAPKGEPVLVHRAALEEGGHALRVTLVFEGTGYGLFPYHRGYTFRVQRDHGLSAALGQHTAVTVVARDEGPLRLPFPERAALYFRISQRPER